MKNIEDLFENFHNNIINRGLNSQECEKILSASQIIIYGGGNSGSIMYERLTKQGLKVIAFIDNGGSIYGKQYCGIPIFTSDEILFYLKKDENYICIVTLLDILNYENIKNQIINSLKSVNNLQVFFFTQFRACKKVFGLNKKPEFSAYLGEDVEILLRNKERIINVYNLLSDKESKNCYLELLNYYIVSDFVAFTVLPFEEHYFAYDLYKKIKDEVFVDCGAYDGDTMDIFFKNQGGSYKKYIAIEADKVNYEKLLGKVKNQNINNIEVIQSFISDEKKKINFINKGTTYSKRESSLNGEVLQTVTLDELVYKYKPTFIKINVEGADVEAIIGAKRIIKECTPIIAAQGHHKAEHLWEIVETIKKFNEHGYKYYLRNYMGIDEFTFYAIPEWRRLIC